MKIKSRVAILVFTFLLVLMHNTFYKNQFKDAINEKINESYQLPVVMYHAFLKDEKMQGKFVIHPDLFDEDISYILQKGYTPILINQLIDFVHGDGNLPEKPIMITIDDGYYNNYLYAFPILKKHNAKAVISPIAKFSEIYSANNEDNAYYSHITWAQGREMLESNLIEFQNHTYDMHSLNSGREGIKRKNGETVGNYQKVLYEDLSKAHNLIRDKFGFNPRAIALPFGTYCADAEKVIDKIGYDVSLSCVEGMNTITRGGNLHMLKRYNRPHGKSSQEFFDNILK